MTNKNHKYFLIILLNALLIILLIVGVWIIRYAFYNGHIRLNYPSFTTYPIQGIDISHHQGKITWQKLNKKYTQFIFIKATEGSDFKDNNFRSYWQEAKKLNIPIGAYHFFTFCRTGKEQASHYIQQVPKEIISLPPAIDLEFGGNCKFGRSNQLLTEINDYLQIVEKHYQQKVIIYTTQDFYEAHLKYHFLNNPIWIRNIYKKPTLTHNRPWLFWQFANRGKLTGIDGFVDLNVFAGNKKDFANLLIKQPVTIPSTTHINE